MPAKTNGREVAAHFKGAAQGLSKAKGSTLAQCAEVARKAMLQAPGAPRRVRNMRNAPTTVVVKSNDHMAVAKWTGPAHIVNNPTVSHFISPKALGRARRYRNKAGVSRYTKRAAKLALGQGGGGGGRHALRMPDGGYRAWSRSRGTKGKHFFEKGAAVARNEVPKAYRQLYVGELGKHFRA